MTRTMSGRRLGGTLAFLMSGLLFLGLTTLIAFWARRIREDFAPQDDLPETQAGPIPAAD